MNFILHHDPRWIAFVGDHAKLADIIAKNLTKSYEWATDISVEVIIWIHLLWSFPVDIVF